MVHARGGRASSSNQIPPGETSPRPNPLLAELNPMTVGHTSPCNDSVPSGWQ